MTEQLKTVKAVIDLTEPRKGMAHLESGTAGEDWVAQAYLSCFEQELPGKTHMVWEACDDYSDTTYIAHGSTPEVAVKRWAKARGFVVGVIELDREYR